jgi:hypothetical protein
MGQLIFNLLPDVGAVTFCNGATGCAGAVTHCSRRNNFCAGQTVSAANSVVGSSNNDGVGNFGPITVLSNGNYVVRAPSWDGLGGLTDSGAIVHGAGNVGTTGQISTFNAIQRVGFFLFLF